MKVARRYESSLVVERSRFFAVIAPVQAEADVTALVKEQKSAHRRALHHCWALRMRDDAGRLFEKSKNDGEVGHPGRVLLELLRRADCEGVLVVSRVFGGVKLGVGGVSRAFREAGQSVLDALADS